MRKNMNDNAPLAVQKQLQNSLEEIINQRSEMIASLTKGTLTEDNDVFTHDFANLCVQLIRYLKKEPLVQDDYLALRALSRKAQRFVSNHLGRYLIEMNEEDGYGVEKSTLTSKAIRAVYDLEENKLDADNIRRIASDGPAINVLGAIPVSV